MILKWTTAGVAVMISALSCAGFALTDQGPSDKAPNKEVSTTPSIPSPTPKTLPYPNDSGWSKTGLSHSVGLIAGETLVFLGSDDIRRGYGGYFSYGRPEPKFRLWSIPAQLVYEFGVDTTHSNGVDHGGANDHGAIWALPYARYRGRTRHGAGTYLDAGLGLYYTHTSHDLNSVISTSPTVDFGLAFRKGIKDEILVGIRFRHVSDAGLRGPNAGQNGIFLMAEYRY